MTTDESQPCTQLRIFTGDPVRAEQAAQHSRLQCDKPNCLVLWPEIESGRHVNSALTSPACDADVLYVAEWAITEARTDKVVIVATRSELFLLRVHRRIVEKVIDPSLVRVVWCEENGLQSEVDHHTSLGLLGATLQQERMAIDAAREVTEDVFQPF